MECLLVLVAGHTESNKIQPLLTGSLQSRVVKKTHTGQLSNLMDVRTEVFIHRVSERQEKCHLY